MRTECFINQQKHLNKLKDSKNNKKRNKPAINCVLTELLTGHNIAQNCLVKKIPVNNVDKVRSYHRESEILTVYVMLPYKMNGIHCNSNESIFSPDVVMTHGVVQNATDDKMNQLFTRCWNWSVHRLKP